MNNGEGSVIAGEQVAVTDAHVDQTCGAGSGLGLLGMAHGGAGQVGEEEVGSEAEQGVGDAGVQVSDETGDAPHPAIPVLGLFSTHLHCT